MSVIIEDMNMPVTCKECNLESYCSLWVTSPSARHPNCPLRENKEAEDGRRTGTWITADSCMAFCSECGTIGCGSPYCPNCGAKMSTDDDIRVGDVVIARDFPEEPFVVLREYKDNEGDTFLTLLKRRTGDIDTFHLCFNGNQKFEKTGQTFERLSEVMEELVSEYE